MQILKAALYSLFIIHYFSTIQHTNAHVLKTDNTLGAVIHIDPEDDPIINTPSNITLDVKDREGKFSFEACKCVFSVEMNNKTIYTEDMTSPTIIYTFPKRGLYRIKITGTPIIKNSFQNFTITYDLKLNRSIKEIADKVEKNKQNPTWIPKHSPHFAVAIFMLVVILYAILKNRKKKNE